MVINLGKIISICYQKVVSGRREVLFSSSVNEFAVHAVKFQQLFPVLTRPHWPTKMAPESSEALKL